GLRMQRLQRAILDPEQGGVGGLGAKLYGIASEGGMRSLGLPGGALRAGEPADFVIADLDDPSSAGASAADLMAGVVFSMERTARVGPRATGWWATRPRPPGRGAGAGGRRGRRRSRAGSGAGGPSRWPRACRYPRGRSASAASAKRVLGAPPAR